MLPERMKAQQILSFSCSQFLRLFHTLQVNLVNPPPVQRPFCARLSNKIKAYLALQSQLVERRERHGEDVFASSIDKREATEQAH